MRHLKSIENMLTKEQIDWFAERTGTTPSGRIVFRTYVVEKFKKETDQTWMSNSEARMKMSCLFYKFA